MNSPAPLAEPEGLTSRLGTWVIRVTAPFVPGPDPGRVELIRMRLFVVFSFLVAANAALFGVLHHVHFLPGSSYVVVRVLTAVFVVSLAFPPLLRAGVPFRGLGAAFMVFFEASLVMVACTDGGLRSGAVFWMAVLPVVAACVGGRRLGWAVSGASVVAGVALFAATSAGLEFPQALSPDDASLHYLLNFLSAAVVVGVTAALYEGPIVHHLEDELQARSAAQSRAEAADRSKTALLANMSHEFRTPLTAVLSGTEILREDARDDDRPILESMERGARRLMATLDGVIDLSRIGGDLDLDAEPTDLAPLIRNAAGPYASRAIEKGVAFEVVAASASAVVDPAAFHRVVSELIDNAVRFTAEGAVTVTLEGHPGRATVSVADTGVGMTAEFAARAAEPFLQASEGHGRTHEGLGLGLTLASQLTHAMGGAVSVETAPGRGTTVRASFPTSRARHLATRAAGAGGPPRRVRRSYASPVPVVA